MKFRVWQVDIEDLTEIANQVKDNFLGKLVDDGIITKEISDIWGKKYFINIQKPNIINRLFKKKGHTIIVSSLSKSEIAELEKGE